MADYDLPEEYRQVFQKLEELVDISSRKGLRSLPVDTIDDFAHHPTAVQVTLEGVRQAYPGKRIWAVFEPRTATSRPARASAALRSSTPSSPAR